VRQLTGTLRHHPGPLIGTLVALTTAATMVTALGSLIGTGATVKPPAGRLTGAAVIVAGNPSAYVTTGRGRTAQHQSMLLPAYRRLPASLAGRIAAVPGVARAVADVSFPVGLLLPGGGGRADDGTSAAPLTGHAWASAALTPFRLVAGSAPTGRTGLVVGSAVAAADHLRPGDRVRLAGLDLPPFTVTGVAAAAGLDGHSAWTDGHPAWTDGRPAWTAAADRGSVFFGAAEAAALYGHPGQADLIGVVARPGVTAAALSAGIRRVVPRADTVATGAARGALADVPAAGDAAQLGALAGGVGVDVVLVSLFVVAGTVALSVGLRRRQFALLRAVGATGGQVRRGVLGELAVLGVAGGVIGFLPGQWLAALAVRGFVRNDLLPGSARAWQSPWLLLAACGIGMIVAELSGFVAARRAGRANPADALRESVTERWWPHPVRIVLGLGGLGGSITLLTVTLRANPGNQLNLAFPLLLAMMATVALLGPLLVALAERVLRWPARALGGIGARLALADVAARPRRIASAVIPVTLCVAMVGTIYTVYGTVAHDTIIQGRQRLVADDVLTAPGPGLAPAALAAVRVLPGVRAAVGLAAADIGVLGPGLAPDTGEAVTAGPLRDVLAPGVAAGSLAGFGPGDVAISTQEAGAGAMGVHVGSVTTVYLADGTPYRARVTALYSRSLGLGDALIPAAAAAGHLGSGGYAEILVRGNGKVSQATLAAGLGRLSARFPGLTVASRSVINALAQQQDEQSTFINNLILLVVALLAAVALVDTLVVATVERREELRLLGRVGATRRQLAAMTGWQALVVSVTGMLLGAGTGVAALGCVSRALTGNWVPYITAPSVLVLAGTVLALTLAATLGPAAAILRGGQKIA
jgi:putative ABC transport system permease protein